eukprot:TRINITY_DN1068_c1_g2_i1.p1 TRINITY_DN1068_c1_g2~~TRINITY_DN1068_c1_g2_i1.p1  ORF type:complete len:515 (+),score=104.60 TRINITY_DN1068_c1_g2_i1:64-1545(+)
MANLDIVLIVVVSVIAALILVSAFVMVWFYTHPDDYFSGYLYKIVIVIGFSLSCFSILMMPLDVANQADIARGVDPLPLDTMWLVVYIAMVSMVLFMIPFLMYFYEADGNVVKRLFIAFAWQLLYLIVAVGIIAIMYAFLGYSDIPVTRLTSLSYPFTGNNSLLDNAICPVADCLRSFQEVTIKPTIVVYAIALLTWIGWALFVLFGGIGLGALPMDLINDWRTRPKDLKNSKEGQTKYIKMRTNLRERAKNLIEEGQRLKREEDEGKKHPRRKLNAYRTKVMQLEHDHDYFNFYNDNQRSPIVYWSRLILGILGIFVSIAWFLQIVLYILVQPPVTGLLNDAFIAMDNVFPLFGTLFFCLFVFYLLWCVIKGTMKFGLRLLIITVHPMEYKGTHMNSFLFNVGLIIMASLAVMQFSTTAFSTYARFTSINLLFGNASRYLRFLKYFYVYNIYIYGLIGLAFLSILFLTICTGAGKREDEKNAEFQRLRDQKV